MNLILFEDFSIISPLSAEMVQTEVEKQIEKPVYSLKRIFSKPSERYFTGKISNCSFKVIRQISGRNSFLPLIKGSIKPYLDGSLIHIRFKMHPIIICMLCGIAGTGLYEIFNQHQFKETDIVPFLVILLFLVFAITEYKSQCSKAKDRLLEITEGEIFTE